MRCYRLKSMYILGVSFDYHDSAAALIKDGKILAAAQEERFSRKKNDAGLPILAIQFCLETAGIQAKDLAAVVHYEEPLLRLDRIIGIKSKESDPFAMAAYRARTFRSWMTKQKFMPAVRLAKELNIPISRIKNITHHQSHAASAFLCSPFESAAVITLDGVGEYETSTISLGTGNKIKKLSSVRLPHSIGLFYSALTAFLGFKVNEDEYKVMGMAGFGQPKYAELFLSWFQLNDDGTFTIEQKFFEFLSPLQLPYNKNLIEVLGQPRVPESDFDPFSSDLKLAQTSKHYADIAASVQKCTEEVILHVVRQAMRMTGLKTVCMAGGVALNGLANGRIKRELGCQLFVQPAAGDAGGALGAALYWSHSVLNQPRGSAFQSPYLGKEFDSLSIQQAIEKSYTKKYTKFQNKKDLCHTVAQLLQKGNVIGWMNGRFEWGPRALGCRSILANPALPDMQKIVNEKIKFREPFRPFAPAVLPDRAHEYFDLGTISSKSDPEYFMLSVCKVRPEKEKSLPAITHVDNTARVQLVNSDENPVFYQLIQEFERLTKVPVILNTSFNLRGEPIVTSPLDAIKTFEWSAMDYLVLGDYLIQKDL